LPGTEPARLALTVSTNDFEEWRPFFEVFVDRGIPLHLMSRADFVGRLSGSTEVPALAGSLNMGRFQYQGWTWDRLNANVILNPAFVQISDGRVERDKSSFELNASAQLERGRLTSSSAVRFSAQAQHSPIEGLKAVVNADVPLKGFVTGRVDVKGTLATLAGDGQLRIDEVVVADEPFDSFSAQVEVRRSIWKLQNIQLNKAAGRMTGELTLQPERHFASGHLIGSHFSLADIHHLPLAGSSSLPKARVDGNLNFELRGQGNPNNFHLQSTWRLQKLSVAGTALGDFEGTLTGDGSELKLQAQDQRSGGQALHISAGVRTLGAWPIEAEAEYSGVRADPWIRAFFNRELSAAVTVDGSFHAEGPLRTPAKIAFQSRVSKIAIDFPSTQWRNVQPVDVRFAEGRLTLNRFVMRGPFTELAIAGGVDFNKGATLALSADGTANATLLTLFDPTLQAAGQSALHLRVAGKPGRPVLNGTVEVNDVNVELKGLPLRFSSLKGFIGLEGERAVVRSLHGTSGGGTVDFSGFTTVAENPHFDLQADLNQVRVAYPADFTSVLDGRLHLAGTPERGEVQGDLIVRQMIVSQNANIIGKIIESSNAMAGLSGTASSPLASKIRLNVRVTSVPPVQVQTPNFRLVSDIDVRLQGSLTNPVQVGSVHFLSGETVFRGNRFTLVRGDINLTNPFRTQAYLDLETQTRVQSYDLTLDITGPFDRLKFAYRSDPPLSQTDIVSLLALGYVSQEQAFPALQGNPTSSVGASAILSEALSSQIGGRIQHLFGVSRIKIDPYVGMPGLGSGERVTVEEQITHELTVTYITDTSYSQYTIVQFELNLTNNVSVLGVRDPNGVFGIEFRFRRRFK
jgi:translocation and assembly module TamB